MISLSADKATEAVLCQADELAEVRDTVGKVMGFFVPLNVFSARLYVENHHSHDYVRIFCARFRGDFNHRTLRQIYERLKTLTGDHAANAKLQEYIDQRTKEEEDGFSSRQ